MGISNGHLGGVFFHQARWAGGEITPEIIVLHDTASRLVAGSAARYLRDNPAKVSVHFVVERNGAIEQQVRTDRRANHAGRSVYHGRSGCNNFSIGIEIVSAGRMTRVGHEAMTWFGKRFDIAAHGIEEIETREHGRGLWMSYTPEQIDAVEWLCQELFASIDTLKDITTHWYVSPGRKVDPNPLFPLEQLRSRIFGREEPVAETFRGDPPVAAGGGAYVQVNTLGDTLNLRRWPSFNPNVIAEIPDGTVLPVLRVGTFEGREWVCVQYGGHEGWVAAPYVDAVTFKAAG